MVTKLKRIGIIIGCSLAILAIIGLIIVLSANHFVKKMSPESAII